MNFIVRSSTSSKLFTSLIVSEISDMFRLPSIFFQIDEPMASSLILKNNIRVLGKKICVTGLLNFGTNITILPASSPCPQILTGIRSRELVSLRILLLLKKFIKKYYLFLFYIAAGGAGSSGLPAFFKGMFTIPHVIADKITSPRI